MKQSKKILCILLVVVMAFSSISIGVSAEWTDYRTAPASRDVHGEPVMSSAQRGSMVLDYVDAMLAEKNIIEEVDYVFGKIVLDFRTIDKALNSIVDLFTSSAYSTIKKIIDLADIETLNYNRIRGGIRRTTRGVTDVDMLYLLVQFANDNGHLITKYINGTLNLGFLKKYVTLEPPQIGTKLNLSLYNSLWDDAAETVPAGINADQMLQHFVDVELLGGIDSDGEVVEPLLPSMAGKTSLSAYPLYQFIENAANAAMTDIALPMVNGKLKRQVQEFFGVVFENDEDTEGDWSNVDPAILEQVNLDFNIDGYTWGSTPQGIIGQLNDFIGTIIDEVFIGVPGLWQKGPNTLIDDNLANVLRYLYENYGDELLPSDFNKLPQAEVDAMSIEELVCYVGTAFIEKEFDYIKLPDGIKSMEELVCYLLLEVAAEVVPEQNYWGKIELKLLTIGRDLIFQIISDIARYYINAYTPINVKQGLDFNATVLACVNWALDYERFGGFFTSTDVTSTSAGTAWQKIDNTIFKIIPISLFGPDVTGSEDLVMNHFFNALLDLDFNAFLSIFYKNTTGPLAKTALDFVVYFLNNALKVVCGNQQVIPTAANTLTKIISDDNIALMANNLIGGLVAAGKPFLQSALQFATGALKDDNDVPLEDSIVWLKVTAPSNYGNKTLDQLKARIEADELYVSGKADDLFDREMSSWNDRIDYDLYAYRTFRDAIRDAEKYIEKYEAAVKAVEEATPGTEKHTEALKNLATFTTKTTTDTEYRIYYYKTKLANSQKEASVTQLARAVTMVRDQLSNSGYTKANFTEAVWAEYQKARDFANWVVDQDIYADEDEEVAYLKQSMVNAARRHMIVVSKLLETPSADYTELKKLIDYALTINTTKYTEETVKFFLDELAVAEAFYDEGDCNADEQYIVDAMVVRLQAAIDQLELIENAGIIIKGALTAVFEDEALKDKDMTIDNKPIIWGMEAYSSLYDLSLNFEATGGATVNIISADGYNAGTGTRVQLLQGGEVIEEYVLVIFGDTSMDSGIDEYDIADYNGYFAWTDSRIVGDTPSYIAADLTLDENVDESDLVDVNRAFAFLGDIYQGDPRVFNTY